MRSKELHILNPAKLTYRGWGMGRSLLKKSVQEWNALRKQDREQVPPLSDADLECLDLSGADLRDADLRGGYLTAARFCKADLRGADLRRAWLIEADFTRADLRGANLKGATLHGTLFKHAKLAGAVWTGTLLDPENWTGALLRLWSEASEERRLRLVEALQTKTALRRKWKSGRMACPEAILSDSGSDTDAFTSAWETYGIREEQVLAVLETTCAPRTMAAS